MLYNLMHNKISMYSKFYNVLLASVEGSISLR